MKINGLFPPPPERHQPENKLQQHLKQYDYIFIGAGCAGLSLLTRMIAAGLTAGKRILLIDKSAKHINDRTWCFWEKSPGFFEPIVYRHWEQLWFHADSFSKKFDITPYRYKMIRGIDFYNYCFGQIKAHPNIEILNGHVNNISVTNRVVQVTIDTKQHEFLAGIIFNSLWDEASVREGKNIYLLQHFKGRVIERATGVFNPAEAILMDFRVSQARGTTFVYVLPLSEKKALVEYTLFSEQLLPDHEYDKGIDDYLTQHLQLEEYTTEAEEFGVIPMTDAKFPCYANGMYHIGTAGGQTKASSGYTFRFIQKQSAAIVQQLKDNSLQPVSKPGSSPGRFHFYDSVLLRVLASGYAAGGQVFTTLFKQNNSGNIFAFLDNESSLQQDIRIISSLPIFPFLKASLKQLR